MAEEIKPAENKEAYVPTDDEIKAQRKVLDAFTTGRNTVQKSYNQFNGRTLYECIDDWTKRWNSWIPPESILDETSKSRIFLSFTRNAIIKYIANIAGNPPKANITAVNKKSGVGNKVFAQFLKDLKQYSENNENYEQKFIQFALEVATKGTGIIYEGYLREKQKTKIPEKFDPETGKISYKEGSRVIFDDCYCRIVPIEDFFITNPYLPVARMQDQPKIIWREVTQINEAEREYGHYKNFKKVAQGGYTVAPEPTTYYRNKLQTEVGKDQVEILRFYNRIDNEHIVMINGVIIYDGPIPFKNGLYPFAGAVNEPFGNDFFWGAGYPHKVMGDQDMLNTTWNLAVDKTYGSLLPFGLTSDLDDMIDDETLQPNRVRKVGDITKWQFQTLPGVTTGEMDMMQMALNMAKENSGSEAGGANPNTRNTTKPNVKQMMMNQQNAMKSLGFSVSYLEDFERDRTILRLDHILQFYAIPKIQAITGKQGDEANKLVYRDISIPNTKLSNGQVGNKVVKIIGDELTPDTAMQTKQQLDQIEMQGKKNGIPTEALAVHVDTFSDWNYGVEVEKYSSFERNQILDQTQRQEYANWRIEMAKIGVPVDMQELVAWVDESFDVDPERFKPQGNPMQQMQQQQMLMQQGQKPPQSSSQKTMHRSTGQQRSPKAQQPSPLATMAQ